jgi:SNF2 family DNA or RNA helicase
VFCAASLAQNNTVAAKFFLAQHRNVLAHKFGCQGTIEEHIDLMLQNKQKLAQELLASDAGINLAEHSDAELLNLVKLDINAIGI